MNELILESKLVELVLRFSTWKPKFKRFIDDSRKHDFGMQIGNSILNKLNSKTDW